MTTAFGAETEQSPGKGVRRTLARGPTHLITIYPEPASGAREGVN